MEEEKSILQETNLNNIQEENVLVEQDQKEELTLNIQQEDKTEEIVLAEQEPSKKEFTFVPAPQEKKHKGTNLLFSSSIICSLWGILICLLQPFGAICTCVGFGLFLGGVFKKKTTSYKWALSISIISLIVSVIFCIIL